MGCFEFGEESREEAEFEVSRSIVGMAVGGWRSVWCNEPGDDDDDDDDDDFRDVDGRCRPTVYMRSQAVGKYLTCLDSTGTNGYRRSSFNRFSGSSLCDVETDPESRRRFGSDSQPRKKPWSFETGVRTLWEAGLLILIAPTCQNQAPASY